MTRIIRGFASILVAIGATWAALAAPAAADPLGGCPPGGPGTGWQLIWSPQVSTLPPPYVWGPAADVVDQHGNNDGYACKVVFTDGSGTTVGQVIDDHVQAP